MPEVIKASLKTGRKKYGAAESRSRNMVPAIVYAKGAEPVMVELERVPLKKTLATGKRILEMEIAGQGRTHVQIKELQYKAPWEEVIHVDFLRIAEGQKVRVAVPIILTGTPEGKKQGGVTDWSTRQIEVSCLPNEVPDSFTVDITALDINDSIRAEQIALPKGVSFTHRSAHLLIVSVRMPQEEKVAEGEAASVLPEVIGAKPAEGEEGAEGGAAAPAGGAKAPAGGAKAAAAPAKDDKGKGDKGKK